MVSSSSSSLSRDSAASPCAPLHERLHPVSIVAACVTAFGAAFLIAHADTQSVIGSFGSSLSLIAPKRGNSYLGRRLMSSYAIGNDSSGADRSISNVGGTQPVTVGAYYYPWHGNNFHNGGGYMRRDLDPPQRPVLGEYDDTKPEIVSRHLQWSRQANINLWVASWFGPDEREDRTTRETIMDHAEIGDMKIALHYETIARVRPEEGFDTKRVVPDMDYICDTYFQHDSYHRIDGRPVIFLYVSRFLKDIEKLEEVALLLRTAANKCGESLYLIGDHVFGGAPPDDGKYVSFLYFDSVTNYDVYGSMAAGRTHAGALVVDRYYDDQASWRRRAGQHGCGFVAAASPGYNDRGVRMEVNNLALSRSLTDDDVEGSMFEYSLRRARDLVDASSGGLLMINSFNQWHEDTQIEPVAVSPTVTSVPAAFTNGLAYSGYGELYLNLLRDATSGYAAPFYASSGALSNYS